MTEGSVDQHFAQILKEARNGAGMSQGKLAKLMTGYGFPYYQQTVRRIEDAKRKVSVGEAAALAVILDLDVTLAELGTELGILCETCSDQPPKGFTCDTCGRAGS